MGWAVARLTTVGYSDVYPVTVPGRLAGGFLALLGVGLFALPTAILGSGLVEAVQHAGMGGRRGCLPAGNRTRDAGYNWGTWSRPAEARSVADE